MSKGRGVWVHTRDRDGESSDKDGLHEFRRVPVVGDEIQLELSGKVYRVLRVVHVLFKDADSDVEIYAEEVTSDQPRQPRRVIRR